MKMSIRTNHVSLNFLSDNEEPDTNFMFLLMFWTNTAQSKCAKTINYFLVIIVLFVVALVT